MADLYNIMYGHALAVNAPSTPRRCDENSELKRPADLSLAPKKGLSSHREDINSIPISDPVFCDGFARGCFFGRKRERSVEEASPELCRLVDALQVDPKPPLTCINGLPLNRQSDFAQRSEADDMGYQPETGLEHAVTERNFSVQRCLFELDSKPAHLPQLRKKMRF